VARENDTDTALLRRARHDAEAFGQFYERHARRIYACLVRDTGNADLAADLTAETFAEALRAVHRFRGVHAASGAAWISAIALNVLRHYQRSDRARTSARRRLGIPVREADPPDWSDVDARAAADARGPEIAAALARLPSGQRHAIDLRVMQQLPFGDVAARLDCSERAARMRVSRALRTLRSQLDD
jgi:RNA polymerase sigma factor (sigma-70 family)